jgi:hypothetical protein
MLGGKATDFFDPFNNGVTSRSALKKAVEVMPDVRKLSPPAYSRRE